MRKFLFLILHLVSFVCAQTQIDLIKQSKPLSRQVKSGTVLPTACEATEVFIKTDSPTGQNLYACPTANNWVLQSGGAGTISIFSNGVEVGSRPILNYSTGPGLTQAFVDQGTRINLVTAIDATLVQTRANAQVGADTLCLAAGPTASAQTCTLGLTLQNYSVGMVVNFIPSLDADGTGMTLAIDGLPPVPVKLSNGTSNPEAADLMAGRLYPIWYDGVAFRLARETDPVTSGVAQTKANAQSGQTLLCQSASASSSNYTCAMNPALGSYQAGMVIHWLPDVSANGGATTLKIGSLAAVPVTLSNGTDAPSAIDLTAGRLHAVWYDGAKFRLFKETDPVASGVAQTRANAQSGQSVLCQSGSASTSAYTCAMSPALVGYQTGMVIQWIPDVSAGGAATLAVGSLAAIPIKLSDGATDPLEGDIVAGKQEQIWFDGTSFRLTKRKEDVSFATTRPACVQALSGKIWYQAMAVNTKDEVAVCAKNASNVYAWRVIY
jgi:hypothetical protein